MKQCKSCGAEDIDEDLAKNGWCSKCGDVVDPETPAEWTPDNNFDDDDDDLAPVDK